MLWTPLLVRPLLRNFGLPRPPWHYSFWQWNSLCICPTQTPYKCTISTERAIQNALKKNPGGVSLSTQICRFLFQYRLTPHSTTGIAPAELLLGQRPGSHLDFLFPDITDRVRRKQFEQKENHDRHSGERQLGVGQAVWVSLPACSSWLPGTITQVQRFRVTVTDTSTMYASVLLFLTQAIPTRLWDRWFPCLIWLKKTKSMTLKRIHNHLYRLLIDHILRTPDEKVNLPRDSCDVVNSSSIWSCSILRYCNCHAYFLSLHCHSASLCHVVLLLNINVCVHFQILIFTSVGC